jgi:hypothetical protein
MSVKKVGGLLFFKVGRIGGSFYLSKCTRPPLHRTLDLAIASIVALNVIVWSI